MTIKIDIQDSKQFAQLTRDNSRHLDSIAHKINKSRKVLVITGAGISCNAGIPDFRSKDGLYNMVKQQHPNSVVKGKDLFDSILFTNPDSAAVFYTFMAQLRKCILLSKPTLTHKFIKNLKDKNKLLRCYTQNIDGLETQTGLCLASRIKKEQDHVYIKQENKNTIIPKSLPSKEITKKKKKQHISSQLTQMDVVQLHGDIHTLKCSHCSSIFPWTIDFEKLCILGEPPACPKCTVKSEERQSRGMRTSHIGDLRPNIVLYGEEHPEGEVIGKCIAKDARSKPDVLLIIGTSLKVVGLKKLIKDVVKSMNRNTSTTTTSSAEDQNNNDNKSRGTRKKPNSIVILINKTDVALGPWQDMIDFHIKCDSDEWILDLKTRVPDLFTIQTKIDEYSKKSIDGNEIKMEMEIEKENQIPIIDQEIILSTPKKSFSSSSQKIEPIFFNNDDIGLLTPASSRKLNKQSSSPIRITSLSNNKMNNGRHNDRIEVRPRTRQQTRMYAEAYNNNENHHEQEQEQEDDIVHLSNNASNSTCNQSIDAVVVVGTESVINEYDLLSPVSTPKKEVPKNNEPENEGSISNITKSRPSSSSLSSSCCSNGLSRYDGIFKKWSNNNNNKSNNDTKDMESLKSLPKSHIKDKNDYDISNSKKSGGSNGSSGSGGDDDFSNMKGINKQDSLSSSSSSLDSSGYIIRTPKRRRGTTNKGDEEPSSSQYIDSIYDNFTDGLISSRKRFKV